jgi:hypothetical protein
MDENYQSDHQTQMTDYRNWLINAEQKSQEQFDKTVLSLSGGALGISFVFLKDIIGPQSISYPTFLLFAWVCWAFSTSSVLFSYHLSHLSLRHAISQVDNETIYVEKPGGKYATWTNYLNKMGLILFLLGVLCITIFASYNLSFKGEKTNVSEKNTTSTISETKTNFISPTSYPRG